MSCEGCTGERRTACLAVSDRLQAAGTEFYSIIKNAKPPSGDEEILEMQRKVNIAQAAALTALQTINCELSQAVMTEKVITDSNFGFQIDLLASPLPDEIID